MPATEYIVWTPAAVRELDRRAIDEHGIPGYKLMVRAAGFCFERVRGRFPDAGRWLVLCGAGNNGGDGYVIARLASAAGLDTRVVALVSPERLRGDAARAHDDFLAAGGAVLSFDAGCIGDRDLVIDAMLGTGIDRPLDGGFADAVAAVNASGLPAVAVDVPSGLDAASGRVMGNAVRAALTVTFVGLKQGLYLGDGPDHCGAILFSDLDVPARLAAGLTPSMRIPDPALYAAGLPPRRALAHKGEHGHVLVIGGHRGMAGAARLAGEAALRAGAGLVSVAVHPDSAAAITAGRPELMVHAAPGPDALAPLFGAADVVAAGPGLGRDDWSRALWQAALASGLPLVVDADALNLLAESPVRREDWILTPHPGEAGRLLGSDARRVQDDRLGALAGLTARYGGVVVLKGHASLVGHAGQTPWLINRGNPGMATAGMGDVLTGIIAALLAQDATDPALRAALGAMLHACAGDAAAAAGQRGLLASDLVAELRALANP